MSNFEHRRSPIAALLLAASLLAATGVAFAQSDKFLCIAGVPGDSNDARFAGCSDVQSYQQTIKGGGAACGVIVVKRIDSASPALWTQAANGAHFGTMRVSFRAPGESGPVFFVAKMTDVLVEHVVNADDSTGTSAEMEKIRLLPASMGLKFTPIDPSGRSGTPIVASINCG